MNNGDEEFMQNTCKNYSSTILIKITSTMSPFCRADLAEAVATAVAANNLEPLEQFISACGLFSFPRENFAVSDNVNFYVSKRPYAFVDKGEIDRILDYAYLEGAHAVVHFILLHFAVPVYSKL